jgi:hypothetical protein
MLTGLVTEVTLTGTSVLAKALGTGVSTGGAALARKAVEARTTAMKRVENIVDSSRIRL